MENNTGTLTEYREMVFHTHTSIVLFIYVIIDRLLIFVSGRITYEIKLLLHYTFYWKLDCRFKKKNMIPVSEVMLSRTFHLLAVRVHGFGFSRWAGSMLWLPMPCPCMNAGAPFINPSKSKVKSRHGYLSIPKVQRWNCWSLGMEK